MQLFRKLACLALCAAFLVPNAGCSVNETEAEVPETEPGQAFETTEAEAAVPDVEVIVHFAVSPL